MSRTPSKRAPSSTRTRQPQRRLTLGFWIALGFALTVFILDLIFRRQTKVAEIYSRYVYGVLRMPFVWLHQLLPVSLTEIAVALLTLTAIPLLILWIVKGVKRKKEERLGYFGRSLRRLVVLALSAYTLYMLYHGLNFNRQSLFVNLELPQRKYSKEELYQVTQWLVTKVNQASEKVERDKEGYFVLNQGENRREALKRADRSYSLTAETTSLIHPTMPRVKPVLLSPWWSYTGVTGMYNPILSENCINTDTTLDEMLFTAQHELAHSQGFSREDEASFWAYYNGIRHPDSDYQYSAWLSTYVYFNNAVFGIDKAQWGALYDQLHAEIKQDLGRRSAYWQRFETPVMTVSEKVNDSFLKVNRVEDGTRSYGRMMDLVMAEYFTYVAQP